MRKLFFVLIFVMVLGIAGTATASITLSFQPNGANSSGEDNGIDTFINRESPSLNYDFQNKMFVKTDQTGYVYMTLLKFDLGTALNGKNITAAVMTLPGYNGSGSTANLTAAMITSNWGEDTVTWNNKPSIGSDKAYGTLSSFTDMPMPEINFNITDMVKIWTAPTDPGYIPNYGTYIYSESAHDYTQFYTSGNGGFWPKLEVTYDSGSTVPEPATMALFGIGLLGAGAIRKKRK